VKPPLTEQVQKYGCFQNFPSGKIAHYLVSGEILVTERMPATSLFHFCLFLSSDGQYILILD
jgi:hypothetical protein